jgi:hypothetical protein
VNNSSDASGIYRSGTSAPKPAQSSASFGVPIQMSSAAVPSCGTSRAQTGALRSQR